jgi:hypothetical protein
MMRRKTMRKIVAAFGCAFVVGSTAVGTAEARRDAVSPGRDK